MLLVHPETTTAVEEESLNRSIIKDLRIKTAGTKSKIKIKNI